MAGGHVMPGTTVSPARPEWGRPAQV